MIDKINCREKRRWVELMKGLFMTIFVYWLTLSMTPSTRRMCAVYVPSARHGKLSCNIPYNVYRICAKSGNE